MVKKTAEGIRDGQREKKHNLSATRRRIGPPVLLPTEPSTVGVRQISEAVRRVRERLK